jgi:hypothetical protein
MVAVSSAEVAIVVTVNVTEVCPSAMVTAAGTEAVARFEVSVTTVPPPEAAPLSVAVPVELAPPCTVAGESVADASDTCSGVLLPPHAAMANTAAQARARRPPDVPQGWVKG